MICPIMSKPIATSYNDSCPEVITSEFVEVGCKKENCAWWTGLYVRDGEDRTLSPEYNCAIVQIAMKSADGTVSA
jgi:hypothetical protein